MKLKIGISLFIVVLLILIGFYSGYAVFGISSSQIDLKEKGILVGPVVISPGCTDLISNNDNSLENLPKDFDCYSAKDDKKNAKENRTNSTCGNGILEEREECDDGNLDDGDGCNKFCKIENGTNSSKELEEYLKEPVQMKKQTNQKRKITGISLIKENKQYKLSISSEGAQEVPITIYFYEKDIFKRDLVEEIKIEKFDFGKMLNEYYLTLRGLSSARGFFEGDEAEINVVILDEFEKDAETFHSKVHKVPW